MKKLILKSTVIGMLAVFSISSTGCFGEFALTRKVYTFNDGIGDKFVKTIVFYAMNIVPVYGIASAADFFILNLVEFWTGSNPLAMTDGEVEQRVVKYKGSKYQITATKNNFNIVPLEGLNKGKTTDLSFDVTSQTWTMTNESGSQKIIDIDGSKVSFTSPKGVVQKGLSELN
jgi:hypothetical protein